jgi:hypothetical protein
MTRREVAVPVKSPVLRAFIGPLHRQAFAQVQLAHERETWVGDTVAARLGAGAERAVATARLAYPLDVADRTLEAVVGADDAHAVLLRLVARAHQREGAVYGALLARDGEEAEVHLRMAAWDHGLDCGQRARAGMGDHVQGPSAVFDLIGEHFLENLPCRAGTTLLSEQPARVTWKHDACPFQDEWDRVVVPQAAACNILSAWLRGFASGADGRVEYRRPRAIAQGDARCEHELVVLD